MTTRSTTVHGKPGYWEVFSNGHSYGIVWKVADRRWRNHESDHDFPTKRSAAWDMVKRADARRAS